MSYATDRLEDVCWKLVILLCCTIGALTLLVLVIGLWKLLVWLTHLTV